MSSSQRTKGQVGEREVAHLLREALGLDVNRNWQAQFDGGSYDLTGVPGWAVEIKRAKQADKNAWWKQTIAQADKHKLKPVLIYRIDGHGKGLRPDEKWQTMFQLSELTGNSFDSTFTVETSLRAWMCFLGRQEMYTVPF